MDTSEPPSKPSSDSTQDAGWTRCMHASIPNRSYLLLHTAFTCMHDQHDTVLMQSHETCAPCSCSCQTCEHGCC
jgi:hypothetical protein